MRLNSREAQRAFFSYYFLIGPLIDPLIIIYVVLVLYGAMKN